jgi:hypothetical protein
MNKKEIKKRNQTEIKRMRTKLDIKKNKRYHYILPRKRGRKGKEKKKVHWSHTVYPLPTCAHLP